MTTYTEPQRPLEFVLYEEPVISRETLTIPSGTAAFDAGMVLGATLASGSATAAAVTGNTGNGTMGTITVGAAAKVGVYTLTVIEPGSNVGTFTITDPEGVLVGKGAVASAFDAGGLAFTLADGSTDFAAGDAFLITVSGTVKYVPYDDGNTDGSNVARAIALYACDASGASDVSVAGLMRFAAIKTAALQWHASADTAAKNKAYTALARQNLIARS